MDLLTTFWHYIATHPDELWQATREHVVTLVLLPVALAVLVSVPLGILATRWKAIEHVSLPTASVLQTIPSLALLALMIAVGFGIGNKPAVIALFLYAILPILRNVYTGIKNVDPAVREAARGMGTTEAQMLLHVELPLAFPTIMAGIRTATVIIIGTATLAPLIGGGGLGTFIVQGLSLIRNYLILVGAIPAAALALLADFLLGRVERWATPWAARVQQ